MSEHNHTLPIRLTQAVIGGVTVQAADARDLHAYLQVGRDFTTWIKARVKQYGFEEGRDYVIEVSPQTGENLQGGRPADNYLVTLDTAKELAMVERNDRGREARRYFIACEKKVLGQAPASLPQPNDPHWAAWLSLSTDERRTRQRDTLIYARAHGTPGMRYAMFQVGMPVLPDYLLGAGQQHELSLAKKAATTVMVLVGGEQR